MITLSIGVALWALVHWFPGAAADTRTRLVERIGLPAYRGAFALSILIALALIVIGWRSIEPHYYYQPTAAMRFAGMALVFIAFLLLGAMRGKGLINRYLRHPQLTAVVIWAVGHLHANGEDRSLLLFIGMSIWAIGSMLLINRRDGTWEKPPYGGIAYDIRALLIGSILFVIFLYAHRWITGIPLI